MRKGAGKLLICDRVAFWVLANTSERGELAKAIDVALPCIDFFEKGIQLRLDHSAEGLKFVLRSS
jgi:hypothetical protein